MTRRTILLLLLLLFGGCSFKSQPNLWQYKSAQSFESYKKNFLRGNDLLAKHDLKEALSYAKSSSDLTYVATIHLGKCALEQSVGGTNKCHEYEKIEPLVSDKKLHNYYLFIQKDLSHIDTDQLPSRYRSFAKSLKNGNIQEANRLIQQMQDPASMMLCLALLDKDATQKSIETALQRASYYGYKKGVVHLLQKLIEKEEDPIKKSMLQSKREILLSK